LDGYGLRGQSTFRSVTTHLAACPISIRALPPYLEEPHFYLHAIGARLDDQCRGIGSALPKHGTAICDAKGYPAYLESSNVKNNLLYDRYGFEITAEITLPDNGPTFWLMRRPAKS
jgi:ribosomal protein S18 acetylase RimI-like enzyme